MKKNIILFITSMFSCTLSAQVGIGTTKPKAVFHVDGHKDNADSPTPVQQKDDVVVTAEGRLGIGTINPTATLEIATKIPTGSSGLQEGMVIPAVSLAKLNAMTNPTEGNLVYINNVSDAQRIPVTNYVVNPGFYKFNGQLWVRIMTFNDYVGMNVKTLIYARPSSAYYPDDNKILTCGRLQFRLTNVSNNYGRPQIKLLNGSATINYGIMLESDRDYKAFGAPQLALNATDWQNLDRANDSRLGYGKMELVTAHITIAGETNPDYYRVKFFWANNIWSVVCTRF